MFLSFGSLNFVGGKVRIFGITGFYSRARPYVKLIRGTPDSCMAIATQVSGVPAYTKCDVQPIKLAPDDGLI